MLLIYAIEAIKIKVFHGPLQRLNYFLLSVLLKLGLILLPRFEIFRINLPVHLRSIILLLLATCGYPNSFLALVSREFHISVKYVNTAVFKNDNELVGIETLSRGFKPANMDNFSLLFGLSSIVILHHYALIFQHRVIAYNQAGLRPK